VTAVIGDSSPGARAKPAPGLRCAGGEVVRGRAAEQKFCPGSPGAGGAGTHPGTPGTTARPAATSKPTPHPKPGASTISNQTSGALND
jgi:hypothetical protein